MKQSVQDEITRHFAPYVTGRWVIDDTHYGRQTLVEHLLNSQDNAMWVVGTRRMGKTSLLRHLEKLANDVGSNQVPLYVDLQGCQTSECIAEELFFSLDEVAERFESYDIDMDEFDGKDSLYILRKLSRSLTRQDKQLLLLIDEAEVLIQIGQAEKSWLAQLRKVLQEGRLRTVIASTKLLSRLTEQSTDWNTSPFLFGFVLFNLWPLERESAISLILQEKSSHKVQVDADLLECILLATNRHPHLIQHICSHLYVPDSAIGGYLRPLEENDLIPNHLLDGFFRFDFGNLGYGEKRILLTVAQARRLSKDALLERVPELPVGGVRNMLDGMVEIGLLRRDGDLWRTGNDFLQRWIDFNLEDLNNEVLAEAPIQDPVPESTPIVETATAPSVLLPERIQGISQIEITKDLDLFEVVKSFFREIRHVVEQDDGHMLLVTSDKERRKSLRSEEEIQIALKQWLKPMCRALNIHLDREPLSGRGFLDFKFSIGHNLKCIAEVKLFHSSQIEHGVDIQLPLYLLADRAQCGIYVPVILKEDGYQSTLNSLHQMAKQRAETHQYHIDVIDIRAWKPKSASKAEDLEDLERYRTIAMIGG